jgi:hypothetical protein
MRVALIAIAAASAIGCGDRGTASSPTATAEALELRVQTAHFRVLAGTAPESALRAAADRLEAEYPRILQDLGLSSTPVMTVRIWQDEASYFAELTRYFGVRYQAAGYVTGPTELRLLNTPQLPVNAVHEFVHAASLSVNPRFGNNPRWFWETVALYENGEFVNPASVDYIVRGVFPTLQQLNADPNAGTGIYQLGYVFGDFIVLRWGRTAFLRLIETNADLPAVLGVSTAEFEAAWQSYLRQRYLSSVSSARSVQSVSSVDYLF